MLDIGCPLWGKGAAAGLQTFLVPWESVTRLPLPREPISRFLVLVDPSIIPFLQVVQFPEVDFFIDGFTKNEDSHPPPQEYLNSLRQR